MKVKTIYFGKVQVSKIWKFAAKHGLGKILSKCEESSAITTSAFRQSARSSVWTRPHPLTSEPACFELAFLPITWMGWFFYTLTA
jgi:hypothetical protein